MTVPLKFELTEPLKTINLHESRFLEFEKKMCQLHDSIKNSLQEIQ